MEEKVKVGFYLSSSLIANLRSLIQQKYQKYEKGLLSEEAELAIRSWIALHTCAQTTLDTNKPNPTPRVALVFVEVKRWLLSSLYFELKPGQQIPIDHIRKAIIEVRGGDKRTIMKWLQLFHKMNLIKPVTTNVWEIM